MKNIVIAKPVSPPPFPDITAPDWLFKIKDPP